jgi:hypothetical protein
VDLFRGSIELARIVFLVGAVFALLYKKRYGTTPGGIIVPGVLAGTLFRSFEAFILTLVSSLICWLIYKHLIARLALSNRWTSLVFISISVAIGLLLLSISNSQALFDQEVLLTSLVTPGLITISAKKYGLGKTFYATLLVTAVTAAIGLTLSYAISYQQLTSMSVQLATYMPLTLTSPLIVLPVSLIMSILAYYRFGIRSGGYLIAPFIAVVIFSSPIQAALMFIGVACSYLAIRLIQKYTLVIGLERFVMSLFCGYFIVTIIDYIAIYIGIPGYRPSPLIIIIAIAVLTNDLSLQPLLPSLKKGVIPNLLVSFITKLAV